MGFNEDQIKEFKDIFECFDQDKDGENTGKIDAKGFASLIRSIGYNPTEAQIAEMLAGVRCARQVATSNSVCVCVC